MNATPGPVLNAARIDIQDLLCRYADAVMRRDPDAWIDCWGADPTWILDGDRISGRDELLKHWHELMQQSSAIIHTVHPGRIALRGGGARGRCTVQELIQSGDGARQVIGAYHDEFEPAQSGWRFRSRRLDTLLCRKLEIGDATLSPWPQDLDDFIDD